MPSLPPPQVIEQTLDAIFESTLMEIWLNGLYTFLFLLTMGGIYSRSKHGIGSKWIVASVTIIMYFLSVVHMIMRWDLIRNGFVWSGSSALNAFITMAKPALWWISISSTVFSANTLIADCLFIWRCWIIWGRNWRVIIPSALLTLVGTVFSVLADVAQIDGIAGIENNLLSSPSFTHSSTVYLALSFATTLIVTLLIAYRILKVDGETRAALGNQHGFVSRVRYTSVIEVIVESAALYSIAELILLVLLVRGSPSLRYAQNLVAQVTGIAPTLIVARITFGLARPSASWSRSDALPSLAFASTGTGTGTGTGDVPSTLAGSGRDGRGNTVSKFASNESMNMA